MLPEAEKPENRALRESDRQGGGEGQRGMDEEVVYAYVSVVTAIESQAPGLERRALNLLRRQSRGVKR